MVVGTGFAIWKSWTPSEVVFQSIKATLNGLTSGTPYFQVTGGRVMDGNNYPYLTGDSLTGNALTNTSLTDKYIPFYSGNAHNLKNSNMYLSGTETIVSGNLTITGWNAITFTEGKELKVNMGEEKWIIVQSAFESANVWIWHWVLRSMYNNAQFNTAIWARAMWRLTSGLRNTAVGWLALWGVTVGTDNTAVGIYASQNTTNGSYNVSVGDESLFYNTGGNHNTALGMWAGEYSYGSKNVFLWHFADVRTTTVGGTTTGLNLTNAIAIGDSAKVWTSNMMQLGNTGNWFISTNWNVGIGVSNPANALSVSGNINVTTGYNIYDGAGNKYITGVTFTGLTNNYIPVRSGTSFVNSVIQQTGSKIGIWIPWGWIIASKFQAIGWSDPAINWTSTSSYWVLWYSVYSRWIWWISELWNAGVFQQSSYDTGNYNSASVSITRDSTWQVYYNSPMLYLNMLGNNTGSFLEFNTNTLWWKFSIIPDGSIRQKNNSYHYFSTGLVDTPGDRRIGMSWTNLSFQVYVWTNRVEKWSFSP